MKRSYNYVPKEDVQACKDLIRIMIKRDKAKGCLSEANYYSYQATKFFDCMYSDFRIDIDEWTEREILKV